MPVDRGKGIRYLWMSDNGVHIRAADGVVVSQHHEGHWTVWKDGKKMVGRWNTAADAKHYADTKRPPETSR